MYQGQKQKTMLHTINLQKRQNDAPERAPLLPFVGFVLYWIYVTFDMSKTTNNYEHKGTIRFGGFKTGIKIKTRFANWNVRYCALGIDEDLQPRYFFQNRPHHILAWR